MTPPNSRHLAEERDLDSLPKRRGGGKPYTVAGEEIYPFNSERSAWNFINNNAHKDLRIEVYAHDENTNLFVHFLSNPGEYHMRGAPISYIQDEMHAQGSLSDFIRENSPIPGLEDASFDYYQIRAYAPKRSGHEWGRDRG